MHCSFFFFFTLITVSNHNCDTLGDECFEGIFSARLASRNCGPNSVLSWDLFLSVIGIHLWF